MLKKRIIAVLPIYNNIVVQSIGFKKYLPVGKAEIAIEFLNSWGIDEIVVFDITSRSKNSTISPDFVKKISKKCFVPLTVGGGVSELSHVNSLIHSGADKISLNNSVLYNPKLITEIAKNYGDQCVVASIDILNQDGKYYVYDYLNKKTFHKSISEVIDIAVSSGAGELFINTVDRDGSYLGYDINLFNMICELVSVPVLACGGAKNAQSILNLLKNTKVSAACAGNYFHFFEHSVNISKSIIFKELNEIRTESTANYFDNLFDFECRITKKSDKVLEDLLYVKIDKEII